MWVPSESHVWALASVDSVSGNNATVTHIAVPNGGTPGGTTTVDVSTLHPTRFPLDEYSGLEDMVSLSNLHEGDILHNLRVRHGLDAIYTYMGPVLVAVNPYQRCDLFGPKHEDAYLLRDPASRYAGTLASEPHVFAVVDRAYMNVVREKKPQAFVITGESGAGKSATTSFILQYLTRASSEAAKSGEGDGEDEEGVGGSGNGGGYDSDEEEEEPAPLKDRIVSATPILEAFGNAKTVRNNNSSRFGKFIKIHFDGAGAIVGASFETYLLEKSRVTYQSGTERNYHIFYQLLAGTFQSEKEQFFLKAPSEYAYLNDGCYTVPGANDADDFIELKDAFSAVGMDPDEVDTVFAIVSAVLLFGNIQFAPSGSDGCTISTPEPVSQISSLLGIDEAELSKTLTTRRIVSRNSIYYKPRTPEEAQIAAGSAAKTLYSRLFDWLVTKINESVVSVDGGAGAGASSDGPDGGAYCGILDIFGFEIFDTNSLEQLLINFCNERLQQLFVAHTFKLQLAEYEAEGLDVESIEFQDNQECLDLIQRKNFGILSMLKDECKVPRGSDENLLSKMHSAYTGHGYYSAPRKSAQTQFVVNHYAGPVTYDIDGFLIKNKDPPFAEFNELVAASSAGFVSTIYAPLATPEAVPAGGGRGGGGRKKGPAGLATQFLGSLTSLMDTLSATVPHFIRCVKPNDDQAPGVFDAVVTMRQVRCQGMLETIEMRKRAYPVWILFEQFLSRFGFLAPEGAAGSSPADSVRAILESTESLAEGGGGQWQIGHTKVFLKDGLMAALDMVRDERLSVSVIKIQRMVRAGLARDALRSRKAAMMADLEAARALRAEVEVERLEYEKAERERLEAERKERERLEAERKERERLEAERLAAEQAERERFEAEQAAMLAAEQAEADAAKREAMEAERKAKEAAEAEKRAKDAAEAESRKAAAEAEDARAQAALDEAAARAAEEKARLEAAEAKLKASANVDEGKGGEGGESGAVRKTSDELRAELGDAYIEGLPAELQGVAMQPPPPPPPRSSSLKVATCEGFLMKRSGASGKGKWEQRFFALTPNELLYKGDRYLPVKGRIKIEDMTKVSLSEEHGKANCFELTTVYRTFVMYAGSAEACENWVVCLALAIKRADRMRAASRRAAAKVKAEIKAGFLKKQGGKRSNWLTRYFVLSTTKLEYKAKKNSASSSTVPVKNITEVVMAEGLFRIDVVTGERTYKLQARSEEEMSAWLHAFDVALHPEKARESMAGVGEGGGDVGSMEIVVDGVTVDLSDPDHLIKSSTMSKRGGSKKSWSTRYVMLTPTYISYAAKEGKSEKGRIHLADVTEVKANDGDQGKEFCFEVVTSYRVFYLAAGSEKEMFEWLVTLKKIMGAVASASRSGPSNGIRKEGWLHKRGEGRKNWTKRWFKLTGSSLNYAEKKNKPLKGSIPLGSVTDVVICSDGNVTKKKSNVFEVITAGRTYYIQAGSVEDMAEWIEAVTAARS